MSPRPAPPPRRTPLAAAAACLLVALGAGCAPQRAPDGGVDLRADGGDAGQAEDAAAPDGGPAPLDDAGARDGGPAPFDDAGAPDGGRPSDGGQEPVDDAGQDEGADAGPAPPLVDLAAVPWIHGAPDCADDQDPPLQVVRYDVDTFVLRQSKCVHFEAPFLYLLIGEHTALLEDTGATSSATSFPLYDTVRGLLDDVLAERGQASIDLVVVHSHGHGDHVAADGQFAGRAGVTVVAPTVQALSSFFGIAGWPDGTGSIDLGGRVVDVVPIPGHQAASIALYDRSRALLLTGDSLYPGRLYVSAWNTFRASVARLVAFTETRPVRHVLGTHVEMSSTPGEDYPIGATYQPDEHPLPLSRAHLLELDLALTALGGAPAYEVHDSFIVYPL